MQVWDREIILTALADYYDKDTALLLQDLRRNFTHVIQIIILLQHLIMKIQNFDIIIKINTLITLFFIFPLCFDFCRGFGATTFPHGNSVMMLIHVLISMPFFFFFLNVYLSLIFYMPILIFVFFLVGIN